MNRTLVRSIVFELNKKLYKFMDLKLVETTHKKEIFLLFENYHISRHDDGTTHHKITTSNGKSKTSMKKRLPLKQAPDDYYEMIGVFGFSFDALPLIERNGSTPSGEQSILNFSEYLSPHSQFNIWISLAKKKQTIIERHNKDETLQTVTKKKTEFCESDSFIVAITIGHVT